jgi:hypothetical protein
MLLAYGVETGGFHYRELLLPVVHLGQNDNGLMLTVKYDNLWFILTRTTTGPHSVTFAWVMVAKVLQDFPWGGSTSGVASEADVAADVSGEAETSDVFALLAASVAYSKRARHSPRFAHVCAPIHRTEPTWATEPCLSRIAVVPC